MPRIGRAAGPILFRARLVTLQKRKPVTTAGVLVLLLVGLSGCVTVRPATTMLDPVAVYVGDYGIHSSLFLPTQDDQFVEYARGDWGYAVENHNLPHDAIGALTVSQGAAFGRLYHPVAADGNGPNPARKPNRMQRVFCERAEVWALIDRLDVKYESLQRKHGKAVVNPETGVAWVHDDEHYSIANNCNHLTANSLEEMGCHVRGLVVLSKFSINSAPPPTPAPVVERRPPEQVAGWAAIE